MLDNRSGNAFTDVPFFNSEFIRANSIKQLNGQFTYKKSGDIMRLKEYKNVYEFDTLGRLIRSYETKKDDGTKDTTSNVYVYSEKNLLKTHKKGDTFGFSTTTYTFDSKNRITKANVLTEPARIDIKVSLFHRIFIIKIIILRVRTKPMEPQAISINIFFSFIALNLHKFHIL